MHYAKYAKPLEMCVLQYKTHFPEWGCTEVRFTVLNCTFRQIPVFPWNTGIRLAHKWANHAFFEEILEKGYLGSLQYFTFSEGEILWAGWA